MTTYTIMESGSPDYATAGLFIDDIIDGQTLTEEVIGEISGTWSSAETGTLTFSCTDTASYFWRLRAVGDAAAKSDGWSNTAWRLDDTQVYLVTVASRFGRLERLQLRTDSTNSQARGIRFTNADAAAKEYWVDSCRIEGGGSGSGRYAIECRPTNSTDGQAYLINNIIQHWGYATSAWGIAVSGLDAVVCNNAIRDCSGGGIYVPAVFHGHQTSRCQNNCISETGAFDYYTLGRFDIESHNTGQDNTVDDYGTNYTIDVPAWNDPGNGDFQIPNTDTVAFQTGADLSAIFTWDIDQYDRGATWSRGPFNDPANLSELVDGLLAYFKCDGSADSVITDSTASENTSDSVGGNALGSGPLGYARQFVTADADYVQWDNANAAFAKFGGNERTVSLWYRRGSSTSAYYVMGMWTDGSQRGWALIADHANGLIYFQWTSDGTNAHQIAIPITKDDNFHHLLFGRVGDTFFLREGTTGARAQQTMASFGAVHDSTGPFSFGCKYNGATPLTFLNGSLAEVGFWDRALTEEEIALLNVPTAYGPDWGASETGSEINFSFSVGISETTEIQESALAGFVFACDISESSSYTLSALSGFTFGVNTTVVPVVNFSALSSFAFDQTISISSEFNPLAITQFIPRPAVNYAEPSLESIDLDWFSSGKTLTASPNWFESKKEKVETPNWFN